MDKIKIFKSFDSDWLYFMAFGKAVYFVNAKWLLKMGVLKPSWAKMVGGGLPTVKFNRSFLRFNFSVWLNRGYDLLENAWREDFIIFKVFVITRYSLRSPYPATKYKVNVWYKFKLLRPDGLSGDKK